jgi:hypothetical protein
MADIQEVVTDQTTIGEDGKVRGMVRYSYVSPTHWGHDGVCRIMVHFRHFVRAEVDISLGWSSGGVRPEFSQEAIAEAMSEAFAMARSRILVLKTLYKEVV